jgi:short-subunit dehydrogenase
MSKVIAIFGAGPLLGLSIAQRFGREKYKVALVSREQSRLTNLASELAREGIQAETFPAELLDPEQGVQAAKAIENHFGKIDVLVYGPSATGFTSASKLTADEMNNALSLFLLTPLRLVQAVLPGMLERREGAILATHGITAVRSLPHLSGPGTAAAAARNYLHALNAELLDTGVFAGNVVVGGYIRRHNPPDETSDGEKNSPKSIAGFEVPVLRPEYLADVFWHMNRSRDRVEQVVIENG